MIATLEYVDILDRSESLGKRIIESDVMEAYNNTQRALNEDKEAQQLIKAFADIKDHYDDIQRFGRYHPDYNEIMKKVRSTKREMDMNDKVATFKIAERNLQKLLDEVSEYVALSVSDQIKAPKDGAALSDSGCGCGSGGGCSCAS
ncbi:regulator [Virgibacillus profundi]|uniref:Regulator n=1 Tax=Virgibacillus profundi TaxID=2024555 RepID=A0A2A2IEA0_9BACI|nr:YlbF family regulator [Virgibacillus profundi]PAV29892.1 regulator [Virgibacillus profundi]PXY54064.1 regulator [Virgibacillus profundi]